LKANTLQLKRNS